MLVDLYKQLFFIWTLDLFAEGQCFRPRVLVLENTTLVLVCHSSSDSFVKMADDTRQAVDKCPVDPRTRELWMEQAKRKSQATPVPNHPPIVATMPSAAKYSLDNLSWQVPTVQTAVMGRPAQPRIKRLGTDREISTIPRATSHDRIPNAAERAALPANAQEDTGHDKDSGNWIYPSQEMFFNAMKRKGHEARAEDMNSIVPIHNAVNERAWQEIHKWEKGRADACGGPKLISFSGDSKALTPKARWNFLIGYQAPFDRHDWIVDRCGQKIDYVIDFYSGKPLPDGTKNPLSFYLDVRPKLNSWEGIKMRALRTVGM